MIGRIKKINKIHQLMTMIRGEKSKEESTQDKAKKESSQRQRVKEDKKEDEASS
ncbi:hypothetical protein BsIDN1_03150 [Bacillus safensis]|uniref:Uncharacterized protein n=1 Tax=Bacillus safensis TaxID=561879 RepID=A0A5S9LZ82_BACIA|nr:hypothetical protein BsIDN1_03150 [Bacillus safensis]